jgi:hypothetical protein
MAYYAELDENNKVVAVFTIDDSILLENGIEKEIKGRAFFKTILGDKKLIQTSYNTRGGQHFEGNNPSKDKSKAKRGNFAGIGYFYDETINAFIPPKPFASWSLNSKTFLWEAPKPFPTDGKAYVWVEDILEWKEI